MTRTVDVQVVDAGAIVTTERDVVRIEGWGRDTFRVQASPTGRFDPVVESLVRHDPTPVEAVERDGEWHLVNGAVTAVVEPSGRVSFRSSATGEELIGEPWFDRREPPTHPHRRFLRVDGSSWAVEARFQAYDGERIYGLGQHTLGRLDLKGTVIDLIQRNSQIAIPVVVSSRGYGMFWNCPAVGRVEFADNHTRWVADLAPQLDYFVYAGSTPAEIVQRYGELTGTAPPMPYWATGYWQSNSFYPSQDVLMATAREQRSRGLPISTIFVDYMHWTHLGNWDWDPELWPDPAGMVRELADLGVRVMVAVWPHVSPHSDHYDDLAERGLLVEGPGGEHAVFRFADRAFPDGVDLALLDLTHPDARSFLWDRLAEHYHAIDIDTFWLDACEPELTGDGVHPRESTAIFARGAGVAVSSMFPYFEAQAVRAGLASVGATDGMLLARSAWAGSQRHGVAVWSGDIQSTWQSLSEQVGAGLNMMVSGIPWWTSDIGGFYLADAEGEGFPELVVRWFQFAVFWPIVRLHGNRHPDFYEAGIFSAGGPNEVWSFGERAEPILCGLLFLRERLRPYVHELLELAAATGVPPVRPLWFQFPDDSIAPSVEDQFVLGPDLLVAPVLAPGQTVRRVYLPTGSSWRDVWSGVVHDGGRWVEIAAPLDRVPLLESTAGRLGIDETWLLPPDGADASGASPSPSADG